MACKASLRWNGTWDEIPAEVRLVPYELGGDYDALSLVGGDSVVDSGRRIYLHKFTYFSVVKLLADGAVQNRHSLYCYRPASQPVARSLRSRLSQGPIAQITVLSRDRREHPGGE